MISSVWSCEIISMILLVHSASFEKSVSRQNNHYIFFSVCPKKLLYFWFTLRIDKVWQYNNEKYQQNKKKNLSKYSTSESSFYPKMERIKVSFLPTFLCIFLCNYKYVCIRLEAQKRSPFFNYYCCFWNKSKLIEPYQC